MNDFQTSFSTCPECGLIHPPDPSGRCPIAAAQKNNSKPVEIKPDPKVTSANIINNIKTDVDFSDMLKKVAEIADIQVKQKKITENNEINKLKQFVIIELTKAFERYPKSQS